MVDYSPGVESTIETSDLVMVFIRDDLPEFIRPKIPIFVRGVSDPYINNKQDAVIYVLTKDIYKTHM